jgi:hypothetical protein
MNRVTAEGDLEWLGTNYEIVGTFPGHQVLRRRNLAARNEGLPGLPPTAQ